MFNWCFKPRRPSGLRETLIEKEIVERTNKADVRPDEHRVRKLKVVGKIDGIKYS